MTFEEKLQQYAKIAVKVGVAIKPDQQLLITSPIESVEFTRQLATEAYRAGAKTVHVKWVDEELAKIRFDEAPDSSFETFPEWTVIERKMLLDENCAFISISASNPTLLKDCDQARVAAWQKVTSTAMQENQRRLMNNASQWLVLSVPTTEYAKKVFPNVEGDKAKELLWEEIFKAVRVDGNDAVENWKNHIETLKTSMNFLNTEHFKYLQLTNSDLSTNLTIELPAKHVWQGGGDYTNDGHYFVANMPTEEVYSMPKFDGINGTVVSTKPLNYQGNLINNFKLTFKDGSVVDFDAEVGKDVLTNLLNVDEGARRCGEIALVPYNSPISNSGLTFYNTLFDENASCHLAFGRAYPTNLEGGSTMKPDELINNGANTSLIHVDFMIGSSDLDIVGIKEDGTKVQVFKDGNWAY